MAVVLAQKIREFVGEDAQDVTCPEPSASIDTRPDIAVASAVAHQPSTSALGVPSLHGKRPTSTKKTVVKVRKQHREPSAPEKH